MKKLLSSLMLLGLFGFGSTTWADSFKIGVVDLQKIIQELPSDQKEVLEMRIYQDLSFNEIAELTGVSINTALGRMRYALMNLRKIIEKNNIILTN